MGLTIGLQKALQFTVKCSCCNKELKFSPYKFNTSTRNKVPFPANIRLHIEGDNEMRINLIKDKKEDGEVRGNR